MVQSPLAVLHARLKSNGSKWALCPLGLCNNFFVEALKAINHTNVKLINKIQRLTIVSEISTKARDNKNGRDISWLMFLIHFNDASFGI